MNKLVSIAEMGKTVFTAQDLAVLWGYDDQGKLYELIKYYVRRGEIFALARGLYSTKLYKEEDLRNNQELLFEIANRLVPNSYVSLFTVLKKEGVIFQYYDAVYSIAERSVTRIVKGVKFVYKQVKQEVLLSDLGIINNGVRVATLERAVADTWYLYPKINLESLGAVNIDVLKKIAKIYETKSLENRLNEMEGE